jgi:hypothetical protein
MGFQIPVGASCALILSEGSRSCPKERKPGKKNTVAFENVLHCRRSECGTFCPQLSSVEMRWFPNDTICFWRGRGGGGGGRGRWLSSNSLKRRPSNGFQDMLLALLRLLHYCYSGRDDNRAFLPSIVLDMAAAGVTRHGKLGLF